MGRGPCTALWRCQSVKTCAVSSADSAPSLRRVTCTVCRLVVRYAAIEVAFQPSAWRRSMAMRRVAGFASSRNGGYRRVPSAGGGVSASTRLTVVWLRLRPTRTAPMVALSRTWSGGCSTFSAVIAARISAGTRRVGGRGGLANKRCLPCSRKRCTLQEIVRWRLPLPEHAPVAARQRARRAGSTRRRAVPRT